MNNHIYPEDAFDFQVLFTDEASQNSKPSWISLGQSKFLLGIVDPGVNENAH